MTRARKRDTSNGDALLLYCATAIIARTGAPRMRLHDPIPNRSPGSRPGCPTPPGVRSPIGRRPRSEPTRDRRPRRDRRWRPGLPVPMSVAGGRFTSTSKATSCAAAADVLPRGRRADTSRGAVGQPRPNPHPRRRSRQSGHRGVRRLAAPDRVRVNRHGSGDPEFPGLWRPLPTILPGPPLVPRWRLSQHERDPCRFSESRSAVPTRPYLAATGPRLDVQPAQLLIEVYRSAEAVSSPP